MVAVILLLVSSLPSPSQEPRRVAPGQRPDSVYREVKEGESRVEGLLQRVECPAGRPVTFVVRVQDRPEKFEAAQLGDVEYIAHTPDFKGPMTCGGRGRGDRVYLTWKKVGNARRVVAVEFLPREPEGTSTPKL
ncbi:MAG TPA: hypothetical protein VFJ02_07330 [Vicinamibacterales bacterium]|nr:hypothetical protein [Vicinamibacterales bacterium]